MEHSGPLLQQAGHMRTMDKGGQERPYLDEAVMHEVHI